MESSTSNATRPVGLARQEFVFSLGSLYSYLAQVVDQRKRRGIRYRLAPRLVLNILAKLCGHASRKPYGIADWAPLRRGFLVQALRLKRDPLPHHPTYRRIFESGLNGEALERLLSEFIRQLPQAGPGVVIATPALAAPVQVSRASPCAAQLPATTPSACIC